MPSPWLERAHQLLTDSMSPVPAELNQLDWKHDLSPKKERVAQHLSAFGNEPGGGFLAFGIAPTGELTGIKKEEVEKIVSQLGNLAREAVLPPIKIEHAIAPFHEKSILFVYIPESTEKPVHLRGGSIEEAYIRSAGQTRKMSKPELGNALLRSKSARFEELPAHPIVAPKDTTELLEMFEFEPLFALLEKPLPRDPLALISELKALRLLIEDGSLVATNLAVLSAAKDMAMFRGHERRGVRLIFYKGKSRVDTEQERSSKKGYAIAFKPMLTFLVQKLPSSEIIRDALRSNAPLYPEVALREIIANAIIHQDLTIENRSPMVEVFSDRIEVSSPGRLVPSVTVQRIIDTSPESRNEMFARLLRQCRICEERGSGIDRALRAIELYGLPPLDFREEENSFRVTIFGPKNYKQMNKDERIRASYQHSALQHLSGEAMTNASLRKRLGVSDTNYPLVTKIINDSVEAGLVKPHDPENKANKHAKYIPYWA